MEYHDVTINYIYLFLNKTSWVVLLHGAVLLSVFCKLIFRIFSQIFTLSHWPLFELNRWVTCTCNFRCFQHLAASKLLCSYGSYLLLLLPWYMSAKLNHGKRTILIFWKPNTQKLQLIWKVLNFFHANNLQ